MANSNDARFAFHGVPRKAGKPFDTKKILGRNVDWIRKAIEDTISVAKDVSGRPKKRRLECPICGSSDSSQFAVIFDYEYLECGMCRLLWISNAPTQEVVNGLYSGSHEDVNTWHQKVYGVDKKDRELFERRVNQIYVPKFEFLNEYVPPPGLFFDVGCATGEAIIAAQKCGWNARGIEADPHLAQFGSEMGCEIVNAYFDETNATKYLRDVDIVTCLNTAEHFYDPLKWFKLVGANMKMGAHLVVEVPRHPSLSTFVNKVFPALVYRGICPPDHLMVFSERSTEICIEAAGLRPIAVWTFGEDAQEMLNCPWINAGFQDDPFLDEVLESVPKLQQAVDDAGFANSIFVIARKE